MRARRRARFKRLAAWAGAVSMAASLAGLPGTNLGLELFQRLAGDQSAIEAANAIDTNATTTSITRLRRRSYENRPSPSPSPSAISVEAVILEAAAEFGISGDYLVSVAYCESTLNPAAVNPAGYHGLFQFDESTWASYGYGSIYDPVAQARTAARLLAAGQASRWPNCA